MCTISIRTFRRYIAIASTIKPETLASGSFDKFGQSGSNHQTLTLQNKLSKQNKHFYLKIGAFTKFLTIIVVHARGKEILILHSLINQAGLSSSAIPRKDIEN